jgi:hypothetical protein
MGLFIIGISYRLLAASLFYCVTNKSWFVNPFPLLGTACLVYSLFNHSPDASWHVVTVLGFFFYDVLGWAKYLGKGKKQKKQLK